MPLLIVPGGDAQTMILKGELDLASAGQLVEAVELCQPAEGDTILDFSGVTFLDAAGGHAIVAVAENLPADGRLVVRSATGFVLRVLHILRVDLHPRIDLEP